MKNYYLLLTIILLQFTHAGSVQVKEYADVSIPDEAFKRFLISYTYEEDGRTKYIDSNRDGEIQINEALAVKEIQELGAFADIYAIQSMQGIEAFKNIEAIEILNTLNLTTLDLTQNIALKKLYIGGKFTSLDLKNNVALTSISLNNSTLNKLDLAADNIIRIAYLSSNIFTEEYPSFKNLEFLSLRADDLKNLNLKEFPNLLNLYITSKSLLSINLEDSPNLIGFGLADVENGFKTLNLGVLTSLQTLQLRTIKNLTAIQFNNKVISSFSDVLLEELPLLTHVCVDNQLEKENFEKALRNKDQWKSLIYTTGESCEATLRTNDFNTSTTALISPNPARESFKVQQQAIKKVELVTMQGQVIRTWKAQPTYSLSGLAKGIYLLRVVTTTHSETRKFIIH